MQPTRWRPRVRAARCEVDMSALKILAFGVTCEIRDDDCMPVVRDHLLLPPQEAQALLEAERREVKERLRYAKPGASVFGPVLAALRGPLRGKRSPKQMSVDFTEFADLSDGQRLTVRSDRGLGWSLAWGGLSGGRLEVRP